MIPGSLIADGDRDHDIAVSAKILGGDAALIRAMNIRTAAAKAFAETDAQERIRRAVLGGHRPIVNLQIGQKVFFWRRSGDLKATSADRAHTHWHGPATIINHHATKVWLSFRGAVVMCSPEQIRRASLEEDLASDNIPEELRGLWKRISKIRTSGTSTSRVRRILAILLVRLSRPRRPGQTKEFLKRQVLAICTKKRIRTRS